jgi:murein DD-endopeptidase MepM/ murein hydrolase activator NlpD
MSYKEEKQSGFFDKLRNKYRLSIYRDESYEEVVNFRLSRLNVFAIGGSIAILFLAIIVSIIAYTPVREFIPGYPDDQTLRNIHENAIRVDSLVDELEKRDQFFSNIQAVVSGEEPENFESNEDTSISYEEISFNRSSEDSLIRQIFEENSEFNLSVLNNNGAIGSLSQLHFFPPVKGLVTNSFNTGINHYGTDIVSGTNEVVKSSLDGTVTMATWTLETGWVLSVQHPDNIISIYKHNAELLKKVGDYVKAGDPIAIIGNSGELTTGPHLHFELWHNGVPLNPEDYISF